jgi:hypothetical protein
MSDAELETLNNAGSDCSSADLTSRPQRSQRIDYRLLNGGSDGFGSWRSGYLGRLNDDSNGK